MIRISTLSFCHPGLRLALVATASWLLVGCGSNEQQFAPVSGKVSFDHQPLSSGWVRFMPERGGRGAAGQIQANGSYSLHSSSGQSGAPPGKYRVTVVSYKGDGQGDVTNESAIPERYRSSATSGLSFEVAAGQTNTFDIQLESEPSSQQER